MKILLYSKALKKQQVQFLFSRITGMADFFALFHTMFLLLLYTRYRTVICVQMYLQCSNILKPDSY